MKVSKIGNFALIIFFFCIFNKRNNLILFVATFFLARRALWRGLEENGSSRIRGSYHKLAAKTLRVVLNHQEKNMPSEKGMTD